MASDPQKHGGIFAPPPETGRMTFYGGGVLSGGSTVVSAGIWGEHAYGSIIADFQSILQHGYVIKSWPKANPKKWRVVDHKRFAIVLTHVGEHTAEVIPVVEKITGLGPDEAGRVMGEAPAILKTGLNETEAATKVQQLEALGAKAYLIEPDPADDEGALSDTTGVHHSVPNTSLVHEPVTDFRAEAKRIGVPVEPQSDADEAKAVVLKIAEKSKDLFHTEAEAQANLVSRSIDDSGKTAVQLVQERGAVALLIKLEQMRFGANG